MAMIHRPPINSTHTHSYTCRVLVLIPVLVGTVLVLVLVLVLEESVLDKYIICCVALFQLNCGDIAPFITFRTDFIRSCSVLSDPL